VLARHDLSAGTGLHWGPLMEGAMGGRDVKAYDVIGDTVNTAKRLCDQAKGNEILVSAQLLAALGEDARPDASRRVRVKGKEQALEVYPLSAA
jgi:class 3 adenylate cyclase